MKVTTGFGQLLVGALTAVLVPACVLEDELSDEPGEEQTEATLSDVAASAGPYWIWFSHSGKCMTVPYNSTENGRQLDQWDCVHPVQNNQLWMFDWTTDGYARIRNVHSQKCVNVSGASTGNGAAIVQWPCGNLTNEQWIGYPYPNKPNFYMLNPRHFGNCLTVQNASTSNGALLVQWACSHDNVENDVQSWFSPL
jgi:Ricin-type beta-trefoil lectin domain-like